MKKEKEKGNYTKMSQKPSKHPLGQRVIVGLLCICLIAVSIPIKHFELVALAAQGKEIVMFPALPDEIREQTVSRGTPLEDLELPETLKAVCCSRKEGDFIEEQQNPEDGLETQQQPQLSSQEPAEDAVFADEARDQQGTALGNNTTPEDIEKPRDEQKSEDMEQSEEGQKFEDSSNSQEGQGSGDGQNSGDSQQPGDSPNSEEGQESGDDQGAQGEQEPEEGQNPANTELPGDNQNAEDIQNSGNSQGLEEQESGDGQESEDLQQSENIPSTEQETETITIKDITWSSEPEYDGQSEESYTFRPILPEEYTLAEGVELPEIIVTLEVPASKGDKTETIKSDSKKRKTKESEKIKTKVWSEEMEAASQQEEAALASLSTPMCGTISEDTVWTGIGTLTNGELIVEPGVRLTINSIIMISGKVVIKGGGTIIRGNGNAFFTAGSDSDLTLQNITLQGNSLDSTHSMLEIRSAKLTLDDGCVIQNCKKIGVQSGGGAIYLSMATATLNNATIKNCSAVKEGGAIIALSSTTTINGGIYQNNNTSSPPVQSAGAYGGGFICNSRGALRIYGGKFLGNTSVGRGGCIYNCGDPGTKAYLYGGYFEGNKSSCAEEKGSGAVFCSSVATSATNFDISGNVQFCGDGTNSGTDGIYLDSRNSTPRKIQISNTLSYPVTLYFKAIENYVIAEGVNDYILLHERDMKKINFVDTGGSGKKWYAVLDEKNNQVYVSPNDPGYAYYVYYISNGAEGTVVDNGRYEIGDITTVKSAEPLKRKGHHFKEWNTKADGTGSAYHEGDTLTIEGDTDLYAIFEEDGKKTIKADFYSGAAGSKETKEISAIQGTSGKVTAPQLKEMGEWTAVGWDADSSRYKGEISPNSELTLTEDTEYYGVYQKDVTLSYEAKGVEDVPESETKPCYANVHSEIGYQSAEFTVALAPAYEGSTFKGWNTKADGTGQFYQPGEELELEEDATLYAVFQKTIKADFYSGAAGSKETKEISATLGTSGKITVPQLKEMENWTAVGWDLDPSGYGGEIAPNSELTITEDTAYYGVYQKDVTLTYDSKGVEDVPESETKQRYANVHQKISYQPVEFIIASAPTREGCAFVGWNTRADGTGESYQAGETLALEEDTTLYAIFQKTLTAEFYSGGSGKKEIKTVVIGGDAASGEVTAPELKEMEGFKAVGWDLAPSGYGGEIAAGTKLTLTKDTVYYGVYEKEITLSYDAKGAAYAPQKETKSCHANVHDTVSYTKATFTVAPTVILAGSVFRGWNTKEDGTGETYQSGDLIELEEDATLYAMFTQTLTADFYSGGAGLKESKEVSIASDAASGKVTAPELRELEGFTAVGWELNPSAYGGEIAAGTEVTLTEDTAYYGVYQKNVTLSYQTGSGKDRPESETQKCYANVHEKVSYDVPQFTVAAAPERIGYIFEGWNTEEDGSGTVYQAGSHQKFDHDTVLYALWETDSVPYQVEHYQQDLEGDGYTRIETEQFTGPTNTVVQAKAKKYTGFTENASHVLRKESGKVAADGSLKLKLYYDRDLYTIRFHLNEAEGKAPDMQTVRFGGLLQPVGEPQRRGYHFKGWFLDSLGSEDSQWDFGKAVEENTASKNVTLYAKWRDETAPVLEEASFAKGYRDLLHWLIRKDSMVITIPIVEEGSGVKRAEYALIPEKGEVQETTAQVKETESQVRAVPISETETRESTSKLYASDALGKEAEGVKAEYQGETLQFKAAGIKSENGQFVALITIAEDFKGAVVMDCTDRAGNRSARKLLTAKGGGVIVEDNAPQIRFQTENQGQVNGNIKVRTEVNDRAGNSITGGIAKISYQLDGQKSVSLSEQELKSELVEFYAFTLDISGAGKHTLRVWAIDNAGNENSHQMEVEIAGPGKVTVDSPEMLPDGEPKTGESSHVQIYATISMIAGFSYLLLYFTTKEHGMTEEKKQELVSKLIGWAKGKGKPKRFLALAVIFLILAYYYSVGRNVEGKWREACEK